MHETDLLNKKHQGFYTFTHENGIIIASKNEALNKDFDLDKDWVFLKSVGSLRVYASINIAPDMVKKGLPLKVVRFLLNKQ